MRFLLVASLLAVAASAQTPNDSGLPLEPEQAAFDATYYDLAVAVDIDSRTIDGTLLMEARIVQPTAAILLDLDTPLGVTEVEEVAYVVGSGEEVTLPRAFERTGNRLRIRLGRTAQPGEGLRLRIAYGGAPRASRRARRGTAASPGPRPPTARRGSRSAARSRAPTCGGPSRTTRPTRPTRSASR